MGIQLRKLERKEFNKVARSFLPPMGHNGIQKDRYEAALRLQADKTLLKWYKGVCPYTTFDTVYVACFHMVEFMGYMRSYVLRSPDEIKIDKFGVGCKPDRHYIRVCQQMDFFVDDYGAMIKSIKKYKTVII